MLDQRWINVRKSRYNSEYTKIDIMAVWEIIDREMYSEQLILRSIKQLIVIENQNIGWDW